MRGRLAGAAVAVALASISPTAQASTAEVTGLASPTQGIVVGPDHNLWVAEAGAGDVLRLDQRGNVLGRFTVGSSPSMLAAGPGGRVWATVTGAKKLTWFDALSAQPTAHDVSTAALSDCGPVAIATGPSLVYFSLPNDGTCVAGSKLATAAADGTGAAGPAIASGGEVFDLAFSGGKIFAPEFSGDVVRRLSADANLNTEATVNVPAGSAPDGVAADGSGNLWVTLFNSGGVARFVASAADGSNAQVFQPTTPVINPFGIAPGSDGAMWLAGSGNATIARVDGSGQFNVIAAPSGSHPWRVAPTPDEGIWFSDSATSRVFRYVSQKPRLGVVTATVTGPTAAELKFQVDARGESTQVVVDYGPTDAYGSTTAPITVPTGVGLTDQTVALSALSPATTYLVRVRGTNVNGDAAESTTGFTTAPALPGAPVVVGVTPPGKVGARVVSAFKLVGRFTKVTKLRATLLAAGDKVRLTCKGKGCPFKAKQFKVAKPGSLVLERGFKKRKLRKGTKIEVAITHPGFIGRLRTYTLRSHKKPSVSVKDLAP